jgi:hypothetical protein
MLVYISAIVFTTLVVVLVIFQLCLTFGMPWGEASMGGKFPGKYPPKMRIVSLINSLVLIFIALIVMVKADILLPQYKSLSDIAIYFVVGFSAVAVILNTITPSKIERKIWLPVAIVLLITSIIVAFVGIE